MEKSVDLYVCVIALVVGLVAGTAQAGSFYWDGGTTNIPTDGNGASAGGNGAWNTTTLNWDAGAVPHVAWPNTTNDTALFGPAGTVTLAEPITVQHIRFTSGANTIAGNTLSFAPGGSISNVVTVAQTFTCGISGSPSVGLMDNGNTWITFAPTSGTVTLGVCTIPYEAGSSDKASLFLDGTTTGNSVSKIQYVSGNQYGGMFKQGSGTWTVGNVDIGTVTLTAGNLVVNGTINAPYTGLNLNGGVFHYNNAGAFGSSGAHIFAGANLDNSSGLAITTSANNPTMSWNANLTFIGSNGVDSDLNLGTGAVTLTGTRTVTIQNAATTLTIGGVIGDGTSVYGLNKAGDGTLWLKAANTYNGPTTVTAGTLKLGNGTTNTTLDNTAFVSVAAGATLNLNFTGTDDVFYLFLGGSGAASGTWGRIGHPTAANTSALLTGDGLINNLGGLAPAGTWYWDGGNVDIGTDGDGAVAGGAGTWSTSIANWDQGFTSHKVWNNTTADKAIFRTAAGTVTLGSNITLGEMLIDGVGTYQIGSNTETYTLNFGGTKTITVYGQYATFKAGISGKPTISYTGKSGDNNSLLLLAPTASVNMDLGTINAYKSPITPMNLAIRLDGASTSNSVDAITWGGSPQDAYLQKYGAGTWTVGNVTLSSIDVQVGKLIVNGTVNNSLTDTVRNNATLGGTGIINDPVTVSSGGILAPGNPTGTLTVTNNNCTINGTLRIEIDGGRSPACGALAVSGNLNISAATLSVNVGAGPVESPLVIATYGTLSGTFAATNGLPGNWIMDYDYKASKTIVLIKPPAGTVFVVQ